MNLDHLIHQVEPNQIYSMVQSIIQQVLQMILSPHLF